MTSLLNGLICARTIISQNVFLRNLNTYKSRSIRKLGPRPSKKLQAQNESIRARGFLRSSPAYDPPSDVNNRLEAICSEAGLSTQPDTLLDDPVVRFNVLKECHQVFDHAVPNSQLCHIETVGDLLNFYNTPVVTTTPYEALQSMDLPKNLHVQQDYVRFHPDTDTMFNGISAFPKTSTLVTGLKTREKYPGFTYKLPWNTISKKV